MIKVLLVLLAVVSAVVFITNRGLHRNYLERAEAGVVLSAFSGRYTINMLTEFAALPARDRGLLEVRCGPVYKSAELLRGSKSRLDPDNEPDCQTLIRSGWKPGWTLADGITFMRINPDL